MIKFRQKTYSGKGMRLVRGIKGALNKADTAIINGSLKIQDKIKGTPRFKRVLVSPKTETQLSRETIKSVRGAQETGRKILKTPINEGIDAGLKYASGNPLVAVSQVTPIPGSSIVGIAGEKALKSKLPKYAKATERFQKGYERSGFSKGLKKFRLPSLSEIPQNLAMT